MGFGRGGAGSTLEIRRSSRRRRVLCPASSSRGSRDRGDSPVRLHTRRPVSTTHARSPSASRATRHSPGSLACTRARCSPNRKGRTRRRTGFALANGSTRIRSLLCSHLLAPRPPITHKSDVSGDPDRIARACSLSEGGEKVGRARSGIGAGGVGREGKNGWAPGRGGPVTRRWGRGLFAVLYPARRAQITFGVTDTACRQIPSKNSTAPVSSSYSAPTTRT